MKKFLDFLAKAIKCYGEMEMKRLNYLYKR